MRLSSSVDGKVWRVCQGSLAMDHAFCAASDMCLLGHTPLPLSFPLYTHHPRIPIGYIAITP